MTLDIYGDRNILYTPEEVRNKYSFVHNFDVSVVMPFYKKLDEFKRIFPHNFPFLSRNGIEVIIAMDESSEEESLLEFIKLYRNINWKIIVNRKKHMWRNPAKAINVGIRHATKRYVFVCSPESQFATDIIYIMRKMLYYYPDHFGVGFIDFRNYENDCRYLSSVPYGSIMVERKHLINIRGYDESLLKWGGDDDNIRARLEIIGVKKLYLHNAKMVHWETKVELENRRSKSNPKDRPLSSVKSMMYPHSHIANPEIWGLDFDNLVYDWENKPDEKKEIASYLRGFSRFELRIKDISERFSTILLVQCFNEKNRLKNFFTDNARYFDAIILLDDGSEDGSYDIVDHEKLILKVQKEREGFNDLLNRNILLDLVSFFNTDWIAFLDVDEIIDSRHCDFSFIANTSVTNVGFNLVHLWDDQSTYNKDYPFSESGVQIHYRMFRNIGYSQILTSKKALHFVLSPYMTNSFRSNVLILHHGHLARSKREEKFNFYSQEDRFSDQKSYDHFLAPSVTLGYVKDI